MLGGGITEAGVEFAVYATKMTICVLMANFWSITAETTSIFTFSPVFATMATVNPREGAYSRTMNTSGIQNVAPARFLKEVAAELKKVTWPTRQETIKLTAVVIAISVIVGAFIGSLDAALVKLTSLVFNK